VPSIGRCWVHCVNAGRYACHMTCLFAPVCSINGLLLLYCPLGAQLCWWCCCSGYQSLPGTCLLKVMPLVL